MSFRLHPLPDRAPDRDTVEVVERKGAGHPDTLCDAIAEELSRALARHYLERFGRILHHNVDKVLLVGGASAPRFGGGEVTEPIELILAGRAVRDVGGERVPIEDLADDVSRRVLRARLHALDPARHVRVACKIRAGSVDLLDVYARHREGGVPRANDSSCGVGFAPETALERLVLATERHLTGEASRSRAPERGEDVKVIGIRDGERMRLTVACAFVDRYVASVDDYLAKKAALAAEVRELGARLAGSEIEVIVNAADQPESGSVYLTVTGTSAEAGDDGEVGRGNRANGLITPQRPMTLEAAAGKNPVTHVGKLYQLTARAIAASIASEVEGAHEATCCLVSEIGAPITEPRLVDVAVGGLSAAALAARAGVVEAVARRHLDHTVELWREILDDRHSVY